MESRIKRVYVDSSAVGGKFNKRVAEQTKPFWDAVGRNEIVVIVSDMLEDEVEDPRTPRRVKNFYGYLLQSSSGYMLLFLGGDNFSVGCCLNGDRLLHQTVK